eukprot:5613422-Pleurochrysis_carterae.AAC.1
MTLFVAVTLSRRSLWRRSAAWLAMPACCCGDWPSSIRDAWFLPDPLTATRSAASSLLLRPTTLRLSRLHSTQQ